MTKYYDPPEDVPGTVFDPHDDTFGPIMAAIQAGEFSRATALLAALTYRLDVLGRGDRA